MAGFAFEEEKLPEKLNGSVWLKVGKYALRVWPILLVVLFLTIGTTFYDSSFVPTMNAAVINAAERMPTTAISDIMDVQLEGTMIFGIHFAFSYRFFLILQAVMILVRAATIYGTFFLTNYISMTIMTDLRRDTFRRIQELSFSYFDKTSSGWLIARMNNDTSSLGDILSWDLIQILWSSFDLIFALATMFSVNWELSLVVLASIPVVAIIVPIFEQAILKAHRTARNAYSHFVGWLAEAIDGAKTIKTLSVEDRISSEAEEITEDIRKKRLHAGRINAFFEPILSAISTIMIAVVILVGKKMEFEDGAISIATIILFIGFTQEIYNPLIGLAEVFSEFMASQAGAEKVMQLLDTKPEIVDRPDVIEKYGTPLNPKFENFPTLHGDIEYENVTFHYGEDGPEVIHPLNLKIKQGTSLAIVGETGSGKTTTVNLLCRFYQPTGGKIKIDGVDYLDRSVTWLRYHVGYVQQTPFVFSSTYFDNIAYGLEDATLEQVIEAAKMVGIHDFISRQPDGYYTKLDGGGEQLSQGQKQLVSFARVLIRDPRILILDEATSSIDTETEAKVQEAIGTMLKGRTSIVIAHRLSTIVNSDRILVMDKGNIVEDGNHKELMEKKGAYYSLYMDQFRDLSIGEQESAYQSQIEAKDIKL